MANTIATCWGYDNSRVKEDHRLGSQAARAQAATWKTVATAYVNADGSGFVEVERNGQRIVRHDFGPEDQPTDAERMTYEEFRQTYESRVIFVCKRCRGEIVMGMCENWEDTSDNDPNPHYYFRD